MSDDREHALRRITSIDAEMISIQREAAMNGANLRKRWDQLFAERSSLELLLWEPKARSDMLARIKAIGKELERQSLLPLGKRDHAASESLRAEVMRLERSLKYGEGSRSRAP